MPIKLNLLAEAQVAEDMRRKDPVKRGIFVGAFIVSVVLIWALTLQAKILAAKSNLGTFETTWKSIEKDYQKAVESRRKSMEIEQKLASLSRLTTNRFLWGSALNAVQQTLNGIEEVQVVRLKTEQSYALQEEVKARTNNTQVIPARPALATEKVTMTVEAMDSSGPQPGGQVNRYKESIAAVDYFRAHLQKTNGVLLTTLSPPTTAPNNRNQFVMFTLQCYFPEKTRN
jgi:hypothetical protein